MMKIALASDHAGFAYKREIACHLAAAGHEVVDFEQIIPRGRIASVDAPEFVTADEAGIPDDAWVLGVAVGGEARAYSLNLLNHHEIVNDRVGEHTFAAVW